MATAWLVGAAVVALLIHGPIAQTGNYHSFADQRVLWGLPHAGDVLSNLAFAAVALWGGLRLRSRYTLFLIALGFTALASAYYHLAPDDEPIAIYVLARTAEVADHAIYAWLQPISGHTLKHVLAAAAAAVIVRGRSQDEESRWG